LNDAEIVRQVRGGDCEAYSQLVERYQNAVYGVAYHYLRNFDDARDAAQESFVQAYVRLGQLQVPDKFGAWIRQITANQCRMWLRQREMTEALDSVTATTNQMQQLETKLVVRDALWCLSEDSRLTVILYYFQSYSLQEIAAFLEVPVTTIKSRLRNARAQLQKELMDMIEETLTQERLPADFAVRVLHDLTSTGAVHSLAFSQDGRLLANDSSNVIRFGTGDGDYIINDEVQLWNTTDGQLLRTFRSSQPTAMESVAFSPDSKLLVCSSFHRQGEAVRQDETAWEGQVQLWEVDSGLLHKAFKLPNALVRAVAFSHDGQTIASGSRRFLLNTQTWSAEIQFWNVETGERLRKVDVGEGVIFPAALTFAPDGKHIAAGTGRVGELTEANSHRPWIDCQVRLYNIVTGDLVRTWPRSRADAQSKIGFSPDGRLVGTGDGPEGDILIWESASVSPASKLAGHQHRVFAVAFSPDGKLIASGSQDATVKLWDIVTGKLLRTMKGHAAAVHDVSFSADGRSLASADIERVVKVWSVV